jgi:hypothetical protein
VIAAAPIVLLVAGVAWYLSSARPKLRQAAALQATLRAREARVAELEAEVATLDAAIDANAAGERWAQEVRIALRLARP